MSSSSGSSRCASPVLTKRDSSGGIFTRAKRRSPVTRSRTTVAKFNERLEI